MSDRPDRDDTVGIVGAGRFGTALARVVAEAGRGVVMWSRAEDVVRGIRDNRENPRVPGVSLPARVSATRDPGELAAAARLIVCAVASTEIRQRARELGAAIDGGHLVVHAIGALASPGDVRVSQVLAEETPSLRLGALAGPALWRDLVDGQFASMVIASRFDEVAAEARRLLGAPPALRLYGGDDLVGVELAAALSGAYTIAVGVSDGLGIGPGPRAVLITRAMAEAARLLAAAGAHERTCFGLAGLGNLLVRSSSGSSAHSRDYALGRALVADDAPDSTSGAGAATTEGARAALAGVRLAERLAVRVPVLDAIAQVVAGRLTPREAAARAADTVATRE